MKRMSYSRKAIINTYVLFRAEPNHDDSLIRRIAKLLGYTIDKNGSNDYVRRVIRKYSLEKK
jgi:hypothetical protein